MPVELPQEVFHRIRKPGAIALTLLGWYDRNARTLPWRNPPSIPPPNPYRVWLSEIMLQQTTAAAVAPYFTRFVERWPTVEALAAADDAHVMTAWAGLGYYARARNLLAAARAVASEHGGRFPEHEAGLLGLPGVGRYTAAAITAIAFDRRAVVVDGNVERVVARLFAVETPLSAAKPTLYALTDSITPDERPGDFAQAMMDLGATICTPRNPLCALCPINAECCAFRSGDPARFPLRAAKAAKPRRHGTIFWIERDGEVLLMRRAPKGLLGGMRALPTGPWQAEPPGLADAPAALNWAWSPGIVEHVFTHFALELRIAEATLEKGCASQPDGEWWPIDRLAEAGLPTVFAKAAKQVLKERT